MALQLKPATKAFLEELMSYQFSNDNLLLDAIDTSGLFRGQAYLRLALYGDCVGKLAILQDWYNSGLPKGAGDDARKMMDNSKLVRIGRQLGVDVHIIVHPGHSGVANDKAVYAVMEALIGAVYVDSGLNMDAVKRAMAGFGIVFTG